MGCGGVRWMMVGGIWLRRVDNGWGEWSDVDEAMS